MVPQLTGLYIPLITPFSTNGELAAEAFETLAHRVLDDGAAGLVALGTTAESATLSPDERYRVLDICSSVCRERAAGLIVGIGSNDTLASARALRELARWPEVSAALTVVPYYTRPGQAGVLAHFRALAADSPVPLVIYNIPYRTGQPVASQTMLELASMPGVTGVKHAVGGVDDETIRLMAAAPARFSVMAGDDVIASALLALGAAGAILASAHICTAGFAELIRAWRAGDAHGARPLGHRLAGLSAALLAEPNPTVIKAVLHAQGQIPTADVRLPLVPASPDATAAALALTADLTSLPGTPTATT
jgi:4-hydroxy-tetrahydrodipicolinate synthase